MRRWVKGVVLACVVMAWSLPDAGAVALGLYVEAGGGSGELTIDPDLAGEYDTDTDVGRAGIGFMLDTSAGSRSGFNYRLGIGLESLTFDPDRGSDIELDGLVITNDVGFAIVKNRKIRFWAGPEVRIGFYSGETDGGDDVSLVSLGLGPVAGINIRLSKVVYLALKGGILVSAYEGEGEAAAGNYDISGNSSTVFVNAGLLFD